MAQRCHACGRYANPGYRDATCVCGAALIAPDARQTAKPTCPGCSKPTPLKGKRCNHCAMELSTSRCPQCFEPRFAQALQCWHCGSERDTATEPRHCPRCATRPRLHACMAGEAEMEQCLICTGLFVPVPAYEAMLRAPDATLAFFSDAKPATPRVEAVAYLRCPVCDDIMNRRMLVRGLPVIVDECQDHGIFFDGGELSDALRFATAGGYAKAAQKNADDARQQARAAARAELERARERERHLREQALRRQGGDSLLEVLLGWFVDRD